MRNVFFSFAFHILISPSLFFEITKRKKNIWFWFYSLVFGNVGRNSISKITLITVRIFIKHYFLIVGFMLFLIFYISVSKSCFYTHACIPRVETSIRGFIMLTVYLWSGHDSTNKSPSRLCFIKKKKKLTRLCA